jgi:hypothetical protein
MTLLIGLKSIGQPLQADMFDEPAREQLASDPVNPPMEGEELPIH